MENIFGVRETDYKKENIEQLSDLIFFNEKGIEIPVQKTYTIEWEIIPNEQVADNFISNPKGHFMYDIRYVEKTHDIKVIIDEPGKIIDSSVDIIFAGQKGTISGDNYKDLILLDETVIYDKPIYHTRNRNTGNIDTSYQQVQEEIYNTVRITFNTLTESNYKDFPADFIFKEVSVLKNNSLSKSTDDNEKINYYTITDLTLDKLTDNVSYGLDENMSLVDTLITLNYSYEQLFPCVRYMGTIKQDKVSTDFVAANTIIILEEQKDVTDDSERFVRPKFDLDNSYRLRFEFQKDSEIKFISSDSISNIIWKDYYESNKTDEVTPFNVDGEYKDDSYTPIYFSVGFQTEIEGCYQNIMAMYIVDKTDSDNSKKYLCGLFTFLTEVEGEDERYRALLGNFGIPDPITYPNIFKSQDPMEEGVDWTLINTKSKELMLTYDNIFPHVGTYKALMGAVKFLGYQDLIFKEWYKIKDQNNRDKYIALQTYDLQKGESLQSKLKRIGVTFGDFERYKKLNRLTMIYHLNEIDDETGEEITLYTKRTDVGNKTTTSPDSGLYKAINPTSHYAEYGDDFIKKENQWLQLPITYKLYEYRTDEILAKLYSVKCWLEKYILGVNCYISDICGEGIILERLKSQAYVTQHHLQDLTVMGNFTPKVTKVSEFINSSANITCSLNEFDSLTFSDYEDIAISEFIKDTSIINNKTVYISAPLETMVVANEYQFQLINNDVTTGSLAEFTDKNYITNPILIDDNEIIFYDDTQNISKIEKDELPTIEISQGNLRYTHGNWKSNIAYSVSTVIDQNTGIEYYTLYQEDIGDIVYRSQQKIFLTPFLNNTNINKYKLYWTYAIESNKKNRTTDNIAESEFIYTSHTKWNVPMLIIRNYKCYNNDELLEGDFILEIVKGRILFRNKQHDIKNGRAYGCEINFGQELENEREQPITLNYTYLSDRVPIYYFDSSSINFNIISDVSFEDKLTECVFTNRYVTVPVNRIGTYTVSVNSYDGYNNIFVNKSDDFSYVKSNPIEIDTIINSNYIKNSTDFYKDSSKGIELTDEEKKTLLNTDIPKYAAYPIYPQTYRIYDIDPVLDSPDTIEYDNISYAIDVPTTGNFLILNNFTEKALNIEELSDGKYRIKLLDENPNQDSIINSSYIGLCIYDNVQKSILTDIYPLYVDNLQLSDASLDYYDINNSYIDVSLLSDTIQDSDVSIMSLVKKCKDTSLLDSSSYFINSINAYIYSANEYTDIDPNNIVVDYDNKLTYVYDTKQQFIPTTVIKICYTTETVIHNQYSKNVIDNETAYRIIDVSVVSDSSVYYVLDGIVDKLKLNNKLYHNKAEHNFDLTKYKELGPVETVEDTKYKLKMCPVHLRAAQYILRINGFSEELTYQYNGRNIMRTQINYEPTPLFFNSYLDTTYSAQIFDYDPKLLQNIWNDATVTFTENDNLYLYRNFPVTVNKGRALILRPNKNQNKLSTEFKGTTVDLKVQWNWKSYLIDDHENWHTTSDNIDKQIVFKSANKVLSIKPELLGTQSPNMICYDLYGNKLINEGDGFIYVDSQKSVVSRQETDTRDIYYKDVFIVGYTTTFEPIEPINTYGESRNISIQETGAPVTGNTSPLNYSYKIYYSDGTIVDNEGADFTLLTNSGKKSKNNKVKYSYKKSTNKHKSVVGTVKGLITFKQQNERDLVNNEELFELDLLQYGTSVTTSIYNLKFKFLDIEKEGIEELNEYIIEKHITDISYSLVRSEGEVEDVYGGTLYDSNLKLVKYTFISNSGIVNRISENKTNNRKLIGTLQVTVKFYVNGIKDDIITTGICNVYQE